MKPVAGIIASLLVAAGVSAGQDPRPGPSCDANRPPTASQAAADVEARFQMLDRERREAAEWEQRRFVRRAGEFVRLWNEFVAGLQAGVYDARKASALSKAFHKLERVSGWTDEEPHSHNPTR